jgi:hypothetical protein
MIRTLALLLAMRLVPSDTAVPNRQPQLAASDDAVALVFGSGRIIWFSRSGDNGRNFSNPVKIAELPLVALGRHRGPRVVFSGKTIVVSAVGGSTAQVGEHAHGLPSDGDLVSWRSQDGGATWSKAIVINDSPGAAREGLHAMAVDAAGGLAAVWLDLRTNGTHLYGAFSHDAGATWSKNVLIYESPDGTICQCCDPSIAAVAPGEFAVMWRNSLGGMRDMYLLRLRDGKPAAQPVKLGAGAWKLNACPMDGGGIAVEKGRLVTAWRRDASVYMAEPGQPERAIGIGKDVALAVGKKGPYVAWVNSTAVEVHMPGASRTEKLSEKGAFPALTALAGGSVLAAWEEDGAIVTRRLN